ncbi:hypothetical protein AB0E88_28000 [Streptomyces sp. NPDC028635]|uniref:hypothetical protein n=1 Tax=Streptomyces sp. NPDC028635 TaxID=3154800 RepID=UPI0034089923
MEETEVPDPAERPVARRRRGRTALLVAGAVVLGLVAGTCVGYVIQADREPTALPSLSQPVLRQATGPAPAPLSAAQDRKVKTDGDLRKLLLEKPAGAEQHDWSQSQDGWQGLGQYAEFFDEPGDAFGRMATDEFRRAAVTSWRDGSGYVVDIRLVQFRQEESVGAERSTDGALYWAEQKADSEGWPLPGTDLGRAYVYHHPDGGAYAAEARAWRGDIAVEIWVHGTKPVSKSKIMELAKRQLERL